MRHLNAPDSERAPSPSSPRYTPAEELANSITHGIGVPLAITGLVTLIILAAISGNTRAVVSSALYGSTLVLLYLVSTLYHSVRQAKTKSILRILDHSAILLLIAGTYTPFTLISLPGPWGWSLFGTIWGLATLGITLEVSRLRHLRGLLISLYVVMGWAVVVAIKPMLENVTSGGLWLLLAGGLCYTGGLVFYLWKRLPYHHAVWHLWVLTGSILHYFAVLTTVLPPSSNG